MALEHWADEEIRNLKTEKERLADQEERENIWKHALSEPGGTWRLPARLEEEFRTNGFPDSSSTFVITGEMSAENHYLRFQRNLVRGTCEYLMMHPPADNRITSQRIYNVLRSSKEFGHFISKNTMRYWISGSKSGFDDLVEEYAIDHAPISTIDARYAIAIKKWWAENSSDNVKPTHSAIAEILKLSRNAVWSKVAKNQALQKLMSERPLNDQANE